SSGTLIVDGSDLTNLGTGWSNMIFGSSTNTGAMNVQAKTWSNNLTLKSGTGVITIAGAQTMGTNNFSMYTDANPVISAAITGSSGTLTIAPNGNTSVGLAGASGTLNVDATELGRLTGWSNYVFGSQTDTNTFGVNAYTWGGNVTFNNYSGLMSIAGTQN